jgi:DNA repair exonuclease SbcCD nuclease subunit
MKFLHTADWQIGKPFQSLDDPAKREALRQARLETVRGLRALIDAQQLAFVVVCGDLFDSATPDRATVSALCSALGSLEVPVYAIPGNHDHGGPGCIWRQDFFLKEQKDLAPNLQVLLEAKPVVLEEAVLLPCPLLRRHESLDPTSWLRSLPADLPDDRPRIVLAHGSTQGFSSSGDADADAAVNQIDLSSLPSEVFDYIALGDWHGMKQVGEHAWFSGTPEQDRFARGVENKPGYVLVVECEGRRQSVSVESVSTSRTGWHAPDAFMLNGDADLVALTQQLEALLGTRTNTDLLKISVQGALSFEGLARFESLVESLEARLLRLQIEKAIQVEPSTEELQALTERQDPLIAQVARELQEQLEADPLAREALRELHLQIGKAGA